jgi:hypothetical protein
VVGVDDAMKEPSVTFTFILLLYQNLFRIYVTNILYSFDEQDLVVTLLQHFWNLINYVIV